MLSKKFKTRGLDPYKTPESQIFPNMVIVSRGKAYVVDEIIEAWMTDCDDDHKTTEATKIKADLEIQGIYSHDPTTQKFEKIIGGVTIAVRGILPNGLVSRYSINKLHYGSFLLTDSKAVEDKTELRVR